uniref:Putative secreted protein n=1 Tax=Anopheles marajoara TaxID=58244 RepID=A0A2M4CDR8_9DIPT
MRCDAAWLLCLFAAFDAEDRYGLIENRIAQRCVVSRSIREPHQGCPPVDQPVVLVRNFAFEKSSSTVASCAS